MSFEDHAHVDGLTSGELDRLAARARAALEWRRATESLEGTGEADGVRATVNGTGALVDLRVPSAAVADGGDRVAERISAAVAAARTDVARLVARSGEETFGEASEEAATIRRTWEAQAAAAPTVVHAAAGALPEQPPREHRPPAPGAGTW